MAKASYIPNRGDIIWIDFDPTRGSEQAGTRPALVMTAESYNTRVGVVMVCPITNRTKGYPTEVALPEGLQVTGFVLANQMRPLDIRARPATYADSVDESIVEEVRELVVALITDD